MIRKYVLPVVALFEVVFAIYVVSVGAKPVPASQPVAQPAGAPFESYIAGAGLVEAEGENIAIGTGVGGVVTDVFVKVGDKVTKGQPLFKIREKTTRAEVESAKANVALGEAKLKKLQESPRPEEIPVAEAKVKEAEAALADAKQRLVIWEQVADKDKRAVAEEDLVRQRNAVQTTQALVEQARANLNLLKSGAWKRDVEIAQAELNWAKAQVEVAEAELDRLTIKAPSDGTVLQVKIREGEYAMAGVLQTPLMVLGATDRLVVRVDVDENDAWRFRPGAEAVAFVRGNRDLSTGVKFVRVEPYVVPKKSLTGESTERVDTRVLQVLYAFDRSALPVYVGQQMDVFIEAPPVGGGTTRAVTAAGRN